MKQKIKFEIRPIFDQKADDAIWHDFTHIGMTCEKVKYDYRLDDKDAERVLACHKDEWGRYKTKYAFGAYHDGKMIGFIKGFLLDKYDMYIRNLYVLPQYNGMGIGKVLLKSAEGSAYPFALNMNIISLPGAVTFYLQNGYRNYDNRSLDKSLNKPVTGVVPVFKWQHFVHTKLNFGVDKQLLKMNEKQPKFIYVGPNSEIEAVGLKTVEGENVIWVNPNKCKEMTDFYSKVILLALSKTK